MLLYLYGCAHLALKLIKTFKYQHEKCPLKLLTKTLKCKNSFSFSKQSQVKSFNLIFDFNCLLYSLMLKISPRTTYNNK